MNVATYYRISTSSQTADPQKRELTEICRQKGWVAVMSYTDIISGSQRERPGLNQMLLDAKQKLFDAVVVVKVDRIARNLRDFLEIIQNLESCGVAFLCPAQQIDTSDQSPCGKMQRAILGAVAEFERGMIRERVQAGIDSARAQGVHFGRPLKKLLPEWKLIVRGWKNNPTTYRDLAERLGGIGVASAHRLAKG